jgi:hypothetical protein
MQVLRETQYLKHGQYGLGVVTHSNSQRTTIDFEQHGTKKFVTSLLVAELLPGHAPAKPVPSKQTKAKKPRSSTSGAPSRAKTATP